MLSVSVVRKALVAVMMLCCVQALLATEPVVLRSSANGRVWQVNLAPGEPIRWAWITGADAAKLTVSNHCTQTASERVVTADGSLFGSLALDVPAAPLEQVCTIRVEQFYRYGQASEKRLSSETVRIVYLPGILGNAIDVASARHVRQSDRTTVFAYDAAWSSASSGAATAGLACQPEFGAPVVRALDGTSGYDTVALGTSPRMDLTLLFDDSPYWTASLVNGMPGLLLLFR